MAGFTRRELESFRGHPVDDLVARGVRLLFVGINPGLWTAATNTHFAHPANRFYPALHRAGITGYLIDPAAGMTEADRRHLLERGVGITNLVNRATVRAAELTAAELVAGAGRLEQTVLCWAPAVVAVVGITAYRTGFASPRARPGRQVQTLAGAELWVLGNPSGLNAHETVETLARAYREPARAAGVALDPPRF